MCREKPQKKHSRNWNVMLINMWSNMEKTREKKHWGGHIVESLAA